jgi:feruloyl-CoA synthase
MSAKPSMSSPIESAARAGSAHPLRAISFGNPAVTIDRRDDGTIYLRPKLKLSDYPVRITDRLHHWAKEAPERVFMAERDAAGGWRKITYAQLLTSTRRIASALLARGLSAEKPIVILSGNSVDHALLAFGALYAGIPFCPVSPAYSLVSRDYGKLGFLMKLLTPGLVFADDAGKFADALVANVSSGTEIAATRGVVPGRDVTRLSDLLATPEHPRLDAAHDAIGPDTIAKFLLTSGSTGNPKAVINTQRMICANQVMLRCISTRASRCPAASRKPCAISARFRRRSISTSPRAMNRCCPICATIPRCVRNSSESCMRCSSRVRRCHRSSGTASTNSRCRRPASGSRC